MKFHNSRYEHEELTYEDVFIFQQYFDGKSRMKDTDITPVTPLNNSLPIVSANMNAVTGKRMAETLARYGGLAVLPQDMNLEKMLEIVSYVKSRSVRFDTPLTVKREEYVRDALSIIHKRAHKCVILVDDAGKPLSIFTPSDLERFEQFTPLGSIEKSFLITSGLNITPEEAYNLMEKNGISSLPIVHDEKLVGILTKRDVVRMGMYSPALDKNGNLDLMVALGINSFRIKAKALIGQGVTKFILDTAHGHQRTMIEAIQSFRREFGQDLVLIAGNVSTPEGAKSLIEAGANGVKVGIGPGAMCTTRMMTGVGRPQFSAVYQCAKEAKKLGGFVIADGGIKEPRDLALALGAGATHIMMGTILAGTFESTGDIFYDSEGYMYKKNYGMASGKAVNHRTSGLSPFEQAKKALFQEGISTSTIYLKEGYKCVGDIVDKFSTGLRSSLSYVGAKNLQEYYEKIVIGVQTPSGFQEGTPHGKIKR